MKKLYAFVATIGIAASAFAQTQTITLTASDFTGLGSNNYNSGAEKTATDSNVTFGGKAITGNVSNTPGGAAAGAYIQAQANNGVIYNTTPLPGKIISITINQGGTARDSSLYGGTSRLVTSTAGDYAVTGTQVGQASTTGWTATNLSGTNYTFFAIKRGANAAYISSIVIEYDASTLAVIDAKDKKVNLVKSTVVDSSLDFGVKADVKIYDMNGRMIKAASVNEGSSIDVSSLAKGVYIVAGEVEGQKVTQKVIKK